MWRISVVFLGLASLVACQTPFGFGGEDWQGNTEDTLGNGDSNTGGQPAEDSALGDARGTPYVLAQHESCAEGQPAGLAASVDDSGDVWFNHIGFSDECGACADWSVTAIVDEVTGEVNMTYADNDDATCDCDCGVQGLEFVMSGFDAGSWTVNAGDDSVTFEIPAE